MQVPAESPRGVVVWIVAVGLVSTLALAPLAAAQTATDQPAADNTLSRIEVQADGDARYVLQVRTALDDDGERATYRQFQEQFRNDTEGYLGPYRERMTGVVTEAGDRLDRDMDASNFTASTSIQSVPREWGVVTFAFTWEGFARDTDDGLVVGDVFRGGMLLTDEDSLEIVAPEGYGVADVAPAPDELDDGTATWHGREDFADGHPRVRFEESSDDGVGLLIPAGVVLVALLGLAGAYVVYDRREGAGGSGVAAPTHADPDRQLLLDAVAARGGRMRQAELVEELPWSKSKTSRLLSDLEGDGFVRKVETGRENVVELVEE